MTAKKSRDNRRAFTTRMYRAGNEEKIIAKLVGTKSLPELRKYRQCFQRITQQPFYDELIAVCSLYTGRCLPAPIKTEYAFWSVTCFPVKTESVIIRLNIHKQEVFTVFLTTLNSGKPNLYCSFSTCKKSICANYERKNCTGTH